MHAEKLQDLAKSREVLTKIENHLVQAQNEFVSLSTDDQKSFRYSIGITLHYALQASRELLTSVPSAESANEVDISFEPLTNHIIESGVTIVSR